MWNIVPIARQLGSHSIMEAGHFAPDQLWRAVYLLNKPGEEG